MCTYIYVYLHISIGISGYSSIAMLVRGTKFCVTWHGKKTPTTPIKCEYLHNTFYSLVNPAIFQWLSICQGSFMTHARPRNGSRGYRAGMRETRATIPAMAAAHQGIRLQRRRTGPLCFVIRHHQSKIKRCTQWMPLLQ